MAESTTLQIASVRAPRDLASLIAASVSAVSPLWQMATTRSPGADHRLAVAELAGQIHLAGDARRRLDQELADQRRVVRGPAGQQHHPLHVGRTSKPSSMASFLSGSSRPRRVSVTARGCSWISLSMKCG